MTEERGVDPPAGAGAGSRRWSVVPGEGPLGLRVAGAILGAIVAVLAVVLAVTIDRLVMANPQDSPIATVFGPEGMTRGQPLSLVLAWAVGPVAAAIAGLVFSVAAVRSVDGAGLWMGAMTYVLAIGLAPLAFVPDAIRDGWPGFAAGLGVLPFLWLAAGAALGPLLVTCLIAGPVWATLLRRTTGGPPDGHASTSSLPIWPVVTMLVLVLLGFALFMAVLGSLGNAGGEFVD